LSSFGERVQCLQEKKVVMVVVVVPGSRPAMMDLLI